VSAKKTERLVNLVIALLATRRYLSVEEIRRAVPGYTEPGGSRAEEAFRRMFERDKEELRELGIPLETGTDSVWDDEPGYRIARRDYALPDIALAPDEAAALGLAARLWDSAGLATPARRAVAKLQAAGAPLESPAGPEAGDDSGLGQLAGAVDAAEPALEPCLAALRSRQVLRFPYRAASSAASSTAAVTEREVEPWGVVSWRGRWYLVGHDRSRDDVRAFRLSRVAGPVRAGGPRGAAPPPPEGVDLVGKVAALVGEPTSLTARLRVRRGAALELRRDAVGRPRPAAGDGWDEIELPAPDAERLADRVTGFGADVVVLGPPEARAAVVRRLWAVLDPAAGSRR
jgi:predicted DNA-binding transcriptional regulator YafY